MRLRDLFKPKPITPAEAKKALNALGLEVTDLQAQVVAHTANGVEPDEAAFYARQSQRREPNECRTCHGEGAIGTGYSASFVDASDAMTCPDCGGSGDAT